VKKYKITNKLRQVITLDDGKNIWPSDSIIIEKLTDQISQLQNKGFITVKLM